jgi:hypothetical protein
LTHAIPTVHMLYITHIFSDKRLSYSIMIDGYMIVFFR